MSKKDKEQQAVEAEVVESQVVETGDYVVKKKPELDGRTKELLDLRYSMNHQRINFYRQEWFRFSRLGKKWRRPKGMHSKMRCHIKYRPNVVSIGYRGPRDVRGLHPSGFKEVLIWKPEDLDAINPAVEAVRIGGSVGAKKRMAIQAKADTLGIRVLNRTV
ncbi:50S ribosomal protein L32e [Candidatus Methanomassiliicoccus intestinalis]|uniref:50S ribosomal protein L32e n=1 Tax=Candidatus Methanomassiliicoccus intestinalis TaxID=1406512 RepID=UPI0037DC2EA0